MKPAKECELRRVHGFLVDHRLCSLEKVVIIWPQATFIDCNSLSRDNRVIYMETIRVSYFLVVSVGQQLQNFSHLMHLFQRGAFLPVRVLNRHEDQDESVVGLLDELVQEFASLAHI